MIKKYLAAAELMERYGGSFVKCIGEAYFRADSENTKKLEETFQNYFEDYQNKAKNQMDEETLRDEYGETKNEPRVMTLEEVGEIRTLKWVQFIRTYKENEEFDCEIRNNIRKMHEKYPETEKLDRY